MTGSERVPTSIVTKSTRGEVNGNESVSTMRHDADGCGRLLLNEFLEEQATLGNAEASADIEKQVADFTRTNISGKLKFVTKKLQMDSTGSLAKFVLLEFVKQQVADCAEVTAQRRVMWWSKYSTFVSEALNRRRAEAMSNVKKGLVGT